MLGKEVQGLCLKLRGSQLVPLVSANRECGGTAAPGLQAPHQGNALSCFLLLWPCTALPMAWHAVPHFVDLIGAPAAGEGVLICCHQPLRGLA